MPSKIRLKRISDRIKEDLAEMLVKEIADPRLSGITITDVTVDRELAFAEVFVSAIEGQERSKEVLAGLQHAATFLRTALAKRIDLRVFPRLRFHWDPTPERADHIERLLAQMREEDAQFNAANQAQPDSAPDEPAEEPGKDE
jgi:ribosome-binding factor A